eukprot:774520-Pyramimonas_sp.AAC.1
MEMAPNGLGNMAYDLCQAARDRTSELRDIVRSTCERLPMGVRPTWLWTQRRAGTNYVPEGDRTPTPGRQQPCEELEEIEAYAVRKGLIPDGHAVLDTACLRGYGGSISLDGYTEDGIITTRMRGSSMRFRGVNDSAP